MDRTQVNPGLGVQELLDSLKASALLSEVELDRAVKSASVSATESGALGRYLVTAGILTAFQLDAVCNRRFADLRIGNYDVLDRLGAGGMGTVFKARHRRMKRVVALKVLSHKLANDETFLQRFQREVEMIARFSHPNIVMAHDADEDDAGPFLVMEFVNGPDLASLVQKQGPMSVASALNCTLQTARGLEYSHRQGIIHRDIKPANLLRDDTGTVKITDLGLARFGAQAGLGESGASGGITQAGGIVGTVDFMAPEQAVDSTRIDHRADIYSLGATLFFFLAGRPPFQGQTIMATLLQHREAPIPSLVQARKDVPADPDVVFRRMMAKAPADRFQTMTEVVHALEALQTAAGDASSLSLPSLVPLTGAAEQGGFTLAQNVETGVTGAGAPTSQTVDLKPLAMGTGPAPRVLLVEPSRTQAGIIRKYVQSQGPYDLVTCVTGQQALEAASRAPFNAIVSALHLADMTGVDLAKQVRSATKGPVPGFVLISSETGGSDPADLSKCERTFLLAKPFTPQQLGDALRLVAIPPSTAAGSSPIPLSWRDRARVLIVDDSSAARLHVRTVLKGLGLQHFTEAVDGAQAVATVVRESFDLIVTDYNMPYMDGRGLVGYLKQNPATASVPIIMVTTEQDPGKLEAVRQLGVAVCEKSFAPEVVRKILEQVVKTP
jgi:serine/threonine protein kinase/CheY-like chemotaxis protein